MKKKKKKVTKQLSFVVLLIGVLATAVLLLDAFEVSGNVVSGLKVAFGGEIRSEGGIVQIVLREYKFNLLLSIALVLPLLAGIINVIVPSKLG